MATPEQILANQENAQLSTGPRTESGKAASSRNATKHGLSAQFLPLSEEERPAFDALESALRREINPQSALQESIFRELAAAAWKRDVASRLLAESCPSTEALLAPNPPDNIRKLLRHKADADRAFNRSLRQLRQIQSPGAARPTPQKITKQTQIPTPPPPIDYRQFHDIFEEQAKLLDTHIRQSLPNYRRRPAA